MPIVFLGSCQSDILGREFAKIFKEKEIISIVNWDKILKNLPVPDELWETDVLIYQPYLGKNDFNTDDICKKLLSINPNVKLISFPYCDFNLYTPTHKRHPKDIVTKKYPFTKFEEIPSCLIDCQSVEEMVKKLDEESLPFNFKAIEENQFLKLRERDDRCSIKITDFIKENWKKERLFYTRNHPTNTLMLYIAREISKLLNLDTNFTFETALDLSISLIPPFLKKELSFDINTAKWYNGPKSTAKEYLEELIKISADITI